MLVFAAKTIDIDPDLNRICVWCHAPHHTLKPLEMAGDVDYLPLWNHRTTTMVYQTYTKSECLS